MSTLPLAPTVSGFAALLASEDAISTTWKVAAILANSGLVPKHFAGNKEACAIALIQAMELRENPLVLMQNMYIVHGMPGFSAKYQIARANKSGIFAGRINWRVQDHGRRTIKGTEYRNLEVTAYATLAETGEEVSFTVGLEMAELEGWLSNSKYRTMPELMYRYRSASTMLRLYAPETLLGDSDVELETMPEQSAKVFATARVSRIPSAAALPDHGEAPDYSAESQERRESVAAIIDPVVVARQADPPQAVAHLSRDEVKAQIARIETALGQSVYWPIRTRMELPLEQSVAALRHAPAVLEEYLSALQGAADARAAALDADEAGEE